MGTATTTVPRADPLTEALQAYLSTGDEAAMERIVRGTRPRLLAAAQRIGAPQDAEDAVQAAYLSLVRRRGTLFDAPVLAWLLTAVVRIAYRRKAVLRRDDRIAQRLALEGESDRAEVESAPEDLDRLRREVARLPARYRDPVVLHHLQGLSTAETARLLDVPEATVRTRCRRARLLVRARWSPRWVAAALAVPWMVKDAWNAAPAGALAAAGGGAMKAGATAAVAIGILAAAAGAFVGSRWLGRDDSSEVSDLRARVATLTQEREALQARVEAAEKASLAAATTPSAPPEAVPAAATAEATAEAPTPATPAGATPAAAPAKPGSPRFAFGASEPALAAVDWKEVGTSLSSMLPLMGKFIEGVRAGKEPLQIPEVGPIQKHNAALVLAALELKNQKIPGRDVNGTFTHPYVQANAIAATLEAAGMPLSEAQAAALERLGREHGEADELRRSRYDERTLALRQVLEEADAREAFFTAAFAVLTQAQHDRLKPAASRDALHGDLFSSGLVWAQYARSLPGADRAAVVAAMQQTVIASFAIPEARQVDARALVESWAPATVPSAASGFGTTLHQVREAAVRQVELESRLLDLGLGAASEKKVIEYAVVHVPSGPAE